MLNGAGAGKTTPSQRCSTVTGSTLKTHQTLLRLMIQTFTQAVQLHCACLAHFCTHACTSHACPALLPVHLPAPALLPVHMPAPCTQAHACPLPPPYCSCIRCLPQAWMKRLLTCWSRCRH